MPNMCLFFKTQLIYHLETSVYEIIIGHAYDSNTSISEKMCPAEQS